MSKIKMRCITCGKWFQSANAKEVTCPDCMQKARREKMAAKTAPPTSNKMAGQAAQGVNTPTRPTVPPPPKPKAPAGGTSHWLDTLSDVKGGEPEQPPRPKIPSSPAPREQRGGTDRPAYRGPGDSRDERDGGSYREGGSRSPGSYKDKEGGYHRHYRAAPSPAGGARFSTRAAHRRSRRGSPRKTLPRWQAGGWRQAREAKGGENGSAAQAEARENSTSASL